jgi:hypothetical protein
MDENRSRNPNELSSLTEAPEVSDPAESQELLAQRIEEITAQILPQVQGIASLAEPAWTTVQEQLRTMLTLSTGAIGVSVALLQILAPDNSAALEKVALLIAAWLMWLMAIACDLVRFRVLPGLRTLPIKALAQIIEACSELERMDTVEEQLAGADKIPFRIRQEIQASLNRLNRWGTGTMVLFWLGVVCFVIFAFYNLPG